MISSWQSRHRGGNVILEFALAFPLLFLLLSGMYQFGYSFFVYNQLQSAVRTGGRYAGTTDFDGGQSGASFRSRIRNVVVYGVTSGGTTPVVNGLTTAQVSVTWLADSKGIPQTITVRISGFSFYAVFRTFTLSNKPKATFIYLGQYIT